MTDRAPDNWFEDIYADSDTSGKGVPWASLAPAPLLSAWLDGEGEAAGVHAGALPKGASCLVVGCGLGDDAVAMLRHGFEVTAFDVAASAIDLASERWRELPVTWVVAELFDPPEAWTQGFDVVIEHRTIQSLPPEWQDRGQQSIADFVAPGGLLVVVADLRPDGAPKDGPPWRLRPDELPVLDSSLILAHEQRHPVPNDPSRERILRIYRRGS